LYDEVIKINKIALIIKKLNAAKKKIKLRRYQIFPRIIITMIDKLLCPHK